MEKHAVPQNIMDFEFKLIAGLTVKQFGTLAISFMTALLVYVLIPIAIISYPIIAVLIVLGITMTFMKINEQPFSVWFINFIRNLFISQRRVYQKDDAEFRLLEEEKSSKLAVSEDISDPLLRVKKLGDSSGSPNFSQDVQEPNLKDFSSKSHIRVGNDSVSDIVSDDKLQRLDNYFDEAIRTHRNKNSKFASIENNKDMNLESNENLVNPQEKIAQPLQKTEESEESMRKLPKKKRFKLSVGNKTDTLKNSNELQINQISGFITDQEGKPLIGARVVVFDSSTKQPVADLFSQENGRFLINKSLQSGSYELQVSLRGYNFPIFQLKLENKLVPIYRYQAVN